MRLASTLLALVCTVSLMAQDLNIQANKDNIWQDFTYDMGSIFGGVGYAYSRPLHWEGKDWKNFGLLAGGTVGLSLMDEEIDHWVGGFREDVPNLITDYGHKYGSPENNYMVTGAIYLTGLFTKNQKLRRTGVLLISSATASGFFQQISKRIVGRARPKADVGAHTFDPLHFDRVFNYDSFPSGHAMLAFTNAYAIAKQFKNPWVKAGFYTLGSIPGLVRVVDRFHWISDVAFSTVFSIFIVESIDRYLDRRYDEKYNADAKKMEWSLNFGPNTIGAVIKF